MLEHQQNEPLTTPTVPLAVPNAAEARVTPDELSAALKTLEDRQANTVAIGSVVDELRLNATPEQIWEQVQAQREQQQQWAQTPKSAAAATTASAPARRLVRGWRGIKGWVWIAFWCTGGLGLFSSLAHLGQPVSNAQTVIISGDSQTETIPVQGKDVIISGDDDAITLQGQARSVTVSGDSNILAGDTPKAFESTGDGNKVQWTKAPDPVTPRPPSP